MQSFYRVSVAATAAAGPSYHLLPMPRGCSQTVGLGREIKLTSALAAKLGSSASCSGRRSPLQSVNSERQKTSVGLAVVELSRLTG